MFPNIITLSPSFANFPTEQATQLSHAAAGSLSALNVSKKDRACTQL